MSSANSSGEPRPPVQQTAGAPSNLPKHDPALLQSSIELAKKFYAADHDVSREDRRKLASFFWQKTALYPALGLPILYGFIQSPNWLKRRGLIPANRSYRLAQIVLGFVGLATGIQFGIGVGTVVHSKRLQSSPAARSAYLQLSGYPPQLGSRYYSMTAKHPELALKNPDAIDWATNPLFPFCLVMNQEIIGEWKRNDQARVDRYKAMEEERNQQKMQRITGNKTPELTGTSWDSVISRNREPAQSGTAAGSSDAGADDLSLFMDTPDKQEQPQVNAQQEMQQRQAQPQRGLFQRPQVPPIQSGTDSLVDGLRDSTYTGDVKEDQKRFDELLERERQGAGVDDFSSSEKTW